ncbi:MAG: hypothetical protein P8184_08770 [Calditrichia bacterium]
MKETFPRIIGCFAIILLFMLAINPASAQLISLKSIPVAEGDQFNVFPDKNLGMGGISLALNDLLHDPFVNPAKGARIRGMQIFSSPTFYSISNENGSARTLPVGLLNGSGRYFGGLSMSVQQLEKHSLDGIQPLYAPEILSEQASNNMYAFGMLGRNVLDDSTFAAASIFWSDLGALEGVDLLFPRSRKIDQSGNLLDVRLGLLRELGAGRSLEALLLYNRLDMTYNVFYLDGIRFDMAGSIVDYLRREKNQDRTNTYGIHVGYMQPVGENGWKAGSIFTFNYKTHPKIPNYELMNIPRDPGNTRAFNVGLGFSNHMENTTFGIDLIYEPIWSKTWAEAASAVTTPSGKVILPGDKAVENHFRFSDYLVKIGIRRETDKAGFQLGMQVRSIRYRLEQYNYIDEFQRQQTEHWLEWSPSWGIIIKFPEFQLNYVGRVTTGTGQPGIVSNWFAAVDRAAFGADYIVAPAGSLTLQESLVFINQLTVSIPLNH